MTIIACTADYAALLGKLVPAEKGRGATANWACHVVRRHRKNLGVVMHERTRMGWYVPPLSKVELPHMPDLLRELVKNTATGLGLTESSIQSWLEQELPVELDYAVGINRSIQSHIRQAIECYDWSDEAHHLSHSLSVWQRLSFIHLQETPRTQAVAGRRQYFYPLDAFRNEIMKFSN